MTTIVDPASPDYALDSFPRDDFPRYVWTERPASLPAEVWTTETTHRVLNELAALIFPVTSSTVAWS